MIFSLSQTVHHRLEKTNPITGPYKIRPLHDVTRPFKESEVIRECQEQDAEFNFELFTLAIAG